MGGILISFIILLIVLGIVWLIIKAIVAAFGLPPAILNIAWLVMLLIALVWVLEYLVPGLGYAHHGRLL